MDYPLIDRAMSYLLLEHRSSYLHSVEVVVHNDRLFWTLWNDLAGSCQIWIVRETIQMEDVEYLCKLVEEIENSENAKPVSDVTGADVPTFEELNGRVKYVGVIITTTTPAPEVWQAAHEIDLVILCQGVWLKMAMLQIETADELRAPR